MVLTEGERHPREHEPERRDGEAERDGVDVQRHAEREHAQRSAPTEDELAAVGRDRPREDDGGASAVAHARPTIPVATNASATTPPRTPPQLVM